MIFAKWTCVVHLYKWPILNLQTGWRGWCVREPRSPGRTHNTSFSASYFLDCPPDWKPIGVRPRGVGPITADYYSRRRRAGSVEPGRDRPVGGGAGGEVGGGVGMGVGEWGSGRGSGLGVGRAAGRGVGRGACKGVATWSGGGVGGGGRLGASLYAVRAIERVPAGSCHFPCSTDPSQSVVSFPCVQK